MELIQEEAKERAEVLEEAKANLKRILTEFTGKEEDIGRNLVSGLRRYWKAKEELGPCPACEDGTLLIIRSPKTGKRFVGCSNYREKKCSQTFPLPQKGLITPLDEVCPDCGHKMIQVSSGRRPWKTCINWAECPGRKEELERRQKGKSKEENAE
jgi:DNA topoisomerase-1